jgi:hypothetical protein
VCLEEARQAGLHSMCELPQMEQLASSVLSNPGESFLRRPPLERLRFRFPESQLSVAPGASLICMAQLLAETSALLTSSFRRRR